MKTQPPMMLADYEIWPKRAVQSLLQLAPIRVSSTAEFQSELHLKRVVLKSETIDKPLVLWCIIIDLMTSNVS